MGGERVFRLVVLAFLAPAGVLVGHAVTYGRAVPDPQARARLLADTGHAWWALALPVAVVLAVAAAMLVAARHFTGRASVLTPRHCAWLAPRLGAAQLLLFTLVEVLERVATGHPLDDLLHHGLIKHGAVTQVAVALVLTVALWLVALSAERLARLTWRSWDTRPVSLRLAWHRTAHRPRSRPAGSLGARAPPVAS